MPRAINLATTIAAAVTLAAAVPARAATATNNLTVTASVSKQCVVATGSISFAAYDPVTTHATNPLDQTGTINVTCTKSLPFTVTLDDGANPGAGSAGRRAMKDSATSSFLGYDIYIDNAHTTQWTSTVGKGDVGNGKTAVPLTAYGRIPGGQDSVQVGTGYTDTVIITVSF